MNRETAGALLAVTATLLWASAFVGGRYLLGGAVPLMDPYTLVLTRFLVAAAVIFGLAVLLRQPLGITRAQWKDVILTSLWMYTLMSLLNFSGQRTVSATMAALILETGPALLLLLWNVVTGRRMGKWDILSAAGAVVGCMLVLNILTPSGFQACGSATGQLLLLGSAVSWLLGNVWNQRMMRAPNKLALVGWCQLVSAALMIPVTGWFRGSLIFPTEAGPWLAAVGVGIFPTALAFWAWGEAAIRLELWKLSLMQNMTPVFTLLAASAVLGEPATLWNILGMAAVVGSLSLAILRGKTAAEVWGA